MVTDTTPAIQTVSICKTALLLTISPTTAVAVPIYPLIAPCLIVLFHIIQPIAIVAVYTHILVKFPVARLPTTCQAALPAD